MLDPRLTAVSVSVLWMVFFDVIHVRVDRCCWKFFELFGCDFAYEEQYHTVIKTYFFPFS